MKISDKSTNSDRINGAMPYTGVKIDEVGWTVIQLLVDQPADQQRSVYCRLDIYKVS